LFTSNFNKVEKSLWKRENEKREKIKEKRKKKKKEHENASYPALQNPTYSH